MSSTPSTGSGAVRRRRGLGVPVRRTRRAVVLAALASAVAAGTAASVPAAASHSGEGLFDLAALPAPTADGKAMVDALDAFATTYPMRVTGSPTEVSAGQALEAEMNGLGYQAQTVTLPVQAGAPAAGPLQAVTATKRGTTRPDEWIMLVGHYDNIASTVYGTYDNGSGTNMLRWLARELADVPTHRSVVFAWYNGEEEGLLASQRHAAALKAAGQQITAVLGFDMVGVAWPVATEQTNSCLCLFHGPRDRELFRPLLEQVNFGFLGFPDHPRKVTVAGNNTRNSDERSFAQQGYPTLRWAGMRTPTSYPAYHLPHDTLATMVSVAGTREHVEQGTANTLKSAYYTLLALDNHLPEPSFDVAVDGLTARFDGTGTSDADGGTTPLSWDFGDGATATGPTPSHTYTAAGTYTVQLTAQDDLWPSVTRSTTQQITVR
jgi:hypothetical protein